LVVLQIGNKNSQRLISTLLHYDSMWPGRLLQTFQKNILPLFSRCEQTLRQLSFVKTMVPTYWTTQHQNQENYCLNAFNLYYKLHFKASRLTILTEASFNLPLFQTCCDSTLKLIKTTSIQILFSLQFIDLPII
jgi:hypothetical protein